MNLDRLKIWFTTSVKKHLSGYGTKTLHPHAKIIIGFTLMGLAGGICAFIFASVPDMKGSYYFNLLLGFVFLTNSGFIAFAVTAGCTHLIASHLSKSGSFSSIVFTLAAFSAPSSLVNATLLSMTTETASRLEAPLMTCVVALNIISVKVVYKLTWAKAALSSLPLMIIPIYWLWFVYIVPLDPILQLLRLLKFLGLL